MGFDRDHRLRTRRDIDAAFSGGGKLVNRQLVVWICEREQGPSRLGLSVSRRVGGAVSRNRVKRCMRAAWRRFAPDLPRPIDVMIVARPAAAPRTTAEAEQALGHLLRRWRRGLAAAAPENTSAPAPPPALLPAPPHASPPPPAPPAAPPAAPLHASPPSPAPPHASPPSPAPPHVPAPAVDGDSDRPAPLPGDANGTAD